MKPLQKGWHATTALAPRRGRGSATVEAIRSAKDIAAIKGTIMQNPRDFALFVLGIHMGLRGSDLLGLRWSDVLDDFGRIVARVEVTEQKTKKRRTIAVQDNARNALLGWLKQCGQVDQDSYVFPNPVGQPMTIQRLHQLVRSWASRSGVKGHFGTHTLRKTYGYHLRRTGAEIVTLMKVFGHSSQSVTLRYIGVEQQEIDEANLRLSL